MSAPTLPVAFFERTIDTRNGSRLALVMSPQTHIVVHAERIATLRSDGSPGPIDREVLRQIRMRRGRVSVLALRGAAGGGSYRFDPALDAAQVRDLGYLLVKSQLQTYRRLLAAGVLVHFHVDWGGVETDAFRAGSAWLVDELTAQTTNGTLSDGRLALCKLDCWMLRHLQFYLTLGLERTLRDVLPGKLPLLELRLPHVREMLARVPPEAIA